ncbi:hypothetical protein [Amorphus sp. 3PC139-8]|uniref:hypothetical protein n=1 Tax=Amorphus sp. 3PC139-8 TaxID=2735676 RepID=UPI00345DC064
MRSRDLLKLLTRIRTSHPHASLVYAQLIMALETRGVVPLAALCSEFGRDPNSSTVNGAIRRLEQMGVVVVDRPGMRSQGYTVRLSDDPLTHP